MSSQFYKKSSILFLCLIPALFFFPVFFQDKTFFAFDALKYYLPWSGLFPDIRPNNSMIMDPVHCFFPPLFYPSHFYYQQSLAEGTLNLWFGSNFCGVPFSFYSHPAFYFFYSLFPLTIAHDLLLFFHLAGTGIFTYLYLTRIGLKPLPVVIGSVAWMFNGYVMMWFEFEHLPMMAMSLSATLYFIEKYWADRALFSFLCIVCATAAAFGTHLAHFLIYQLLFIGLYLLHRCIPATQIGRINIWKQSVTPCFTIAMAILIGFVVSTNFFTTHAMLLQESNRQPMAFAQLFQHTGQLPVKYLTTLLFPDFFGSPTTDLIFTPKLHASQHYNNYTELCIYAGIVTFFLASACIPFLFRNRHIGLFLPVAAVSLSMAMGSLLYYPMAEFVPGLNLSTPTRILYIFGFSLSILSALGAQCLQSESIGRKAPITAIWCLILIAAFAVVVVTRTDAGLKWAVGSTNWHSWLPHLPSLHSHYALFSGALLRPMLIISAAFIILSGALFSARASHKRVFLILCILLLSYDLCSYGSRYNTASPRDMEFPPTDGIRFLQRDRSRFRVMTIGSFLHQGFVPFGIEDLSGYGSVYPRRYGEYLHLSQYGKEKAIPESFSRWIYLNRFGSPLIDLLNTKYVLLPPNSATDFIQLKPVYSGEITIFENRNAFPRAFFVQQFLHAESARKAYELLGTFSREDFSNNVILESPPPVEWTRGKETGTPGGNGSSLQILSYEPNRMEMDVQAGTKGFVVIGDNYHPDWKGAVDGNPAPVLRANYIMRAVPVPAGRHKVTLTFQPKLLLFGLAVTLAGWGILLAIMGTCLLAPWIGAVRKLKTTRNRRSDPNSPS